MTSYRETAAEMEALLLDMRDATQSLRCCPRFEVGAKTCALQRDEHAAGGEPHPAAQGLPHQGPGGHRGGARGDRSASHDDATHDLDPPTRRCCSGAKISLYMPMSSARVKLRTEEHPMTNQITIWSFRFTPARGNHVIAERKCAEAEGQAWLAVYREDEPNVIFVACAKKPKVS